MCKLIPCVLPALLVWTSCVGEPNESDSTDAAGDSGGSEVPGGNDGGDGDGEAVPDRDGEELCAPLTCDAVCGGTFDDRCGGQIECPPCPCTPETCESLHLPCGSSPDGCGGTLDCGACGPCDDYPRCWEVGPDGSRHSGAERCGTLWSPCDDSWANDCGACDELAGSCVDNRCVCSAEDDLFEPNDSRETAIDLGAFRDDGEVCLARVASLSSPSDEDWYVLDVEDTFSWGSPRFDLRVNHSDGEDYGIDHLGITWTAWFVCDSGDNDSYCFTIYHSATAETEDVVFGDGCAATGWGIFYPECDGTIDEGGTLIIRVAHNQSADPETFSCLGYELLIGIEDNNQDGCSGIEGLSELECNNGETVLRRATCDSEDDCGDGSDESQDLCAWQ